MKVKDNVKSMKRNKGSRERGSKEIRGKIDLTQNVETRAQKKASQQTR